MTNESRAVQTSFDAETGVATLTLAMAGRANKINADFGEGLLAALDWDYTPQVCHIRKGGVVRAYRHIYLARRFPVEISVYELMDRRRAQRSRQASLHTASTKSS